MSTPDETQSRRERTILYVAVGVVIGVLLVLALVLYRAADRTHDAEAKADQLIQALDEAGATVSPSKDQIVRVLGDDGGATCADPNDPLNRATLQAQLANGAGGPGSRPVISDRKILRGQMLIIQIYCPDELEEFQQYVDSLETDDVTGA
ncbi:hypothetical protein ACFWEJ_12255 [Promicromonospora sp. NPDC060204]|uniref:hypothetical protein n=1 Tax=Promicromonospora sp. NPDC060204 TaxID=3347071 RepID=UPI00364A53A4